MTMVTRPVSPLPGCQSAWATVPWPVWRHARSTQHAIRCLRGVPAQAHAKWNKVGQYLLLGMVSRLAVLSTNGILGISAVLSTIWIIGTSATLSKYCNMKNLQHPLCFLDGWYLALYRDCDIEDLLSVLDL